MGEITQALETNPVLEDDQFEEEKPPEEEELSLGNYADGNESPPEEAKTDGEAKSAAEEWDWDSFLKDRLMPPPMGEYEEREALPFESLNAQEITLKSHLIWQLRMAELDQEGDNIGVMIIGNLDKDGYFRSTVEEIADEMQMPGMPMKILGMLCLCSLLAAPVALDHDQTLMLDFLVGREPMLALQALPATANG